MIERTNEAARLVNQIEDNVVQEVRDEIHGLARDVNTFIRNCQEAVNGHTDKLEKIDRDMLKQNKQFHLLYWSVLEQHELNRGVPSVLAQPDNVFGGIAPNHEQYLLTVARREIKETMQALKSLNAVPVVYPGLLPLPLSARPMIQHI